MPVWCYRVTYEDSDWEEMEPCEALRAVECAQAWEEAKSRKDRLHDGASSNDSSSVCWRFTWHMLHACCLFLLLPLLLLAPGSRTCFPDLLPASTFRRLPPRPCCPLPSLPRLTLLSTYRPRRARLQPIEGCPPHSFSVGDARAESRRKPRECAGAGR